MCLWLRKIFYVISIILNCLWKINCSNNEPNVKYNGRKLNLKENVLKSELVSSADIADQFKKGLNDKTLPLDITKLIRNDGYQVEEYELETDDEYVIKVQRIKGNRSPILLLHGIGATAECFVIGECKFAFTYKLVDMGYDIWLGNNRGTKYSRKHKRLSDEERSYWQFSWEEMGLYDLPTMIDFIINKTGYNNLHYVGWSEGTTQMFVLLSMKPEYNTKIKSFNAIAPLVFMKHIPNPIARLLSVAPNTVNLIFQSLGIYEIKFGQLVRNFIKKKTASNPLSELVTLNIINVMFGFDESEINVTAVPEILTYFPGAFGTKQAIHYIQEVKSGRFCRFDYGNSKNLIKYGKPTPSDYPLDKVSTPICIFLGIYDAITAKVDVDRLVKILPNVICYNLYKMNHVDYFYGKHAEIVLNDVIDNIQKYEDNV